MMVQQWLNTHIANRTRLNIRKTRKREKQKGEKKRKKKGKEARKKEEPKDAREDLVVFLQLKVTATRLLTHLMMTLQVIKRLLFLSPKKKRRKAIGQHTCYGLPGREKKLTKRTLICHSLKLVKLYPRDGKK